MGVIAGMTLAGALFGAAAGREPADLADMKARAEEAEARDDWLAARAALEAVLADPRAAELGATERGQLQLRLGFCKAMTGDSIAAIALYQAGIAQIEHDEGPESDNLIRPLIRCAGACPSTPHAALALPMVTRALALAERFIPAESPRMVQVLEQVAWVRMMAVDGDGALPLLDRAVTLGRRLAPAADKHLAGALNTLGWFHYKAEGDAGRALPLMREALDIAGRIHGRDSLAYGFVLNRVAAVATSCGLVHEALEAGAEYNRLIEKYSTRESGWFADGLKSQGVREAMLGRFADAERDLTAALLTYGLRFEPWHPPAIDCRLRLADIAWESGDENEAERIWREVNTLARQGTPPDWEDAVMASLQLAATARRSGDSDGARVWLGEADSLASNGVSDPVRWAVVESRIGWDVEAGRWSEVIAATEAQRAVRLDRGIRTGSEVARLLVWQAEAELETGRFDEAKRHVDEARRWIVEARVESPLAVETMEVLCRIQAATGHGTEALDSARELERAEAAWLRRVLAFTSEAQRLRAQRRAAAVDAMAALGDASGIATAVLRRKGVVLESLLEDEAIARRHPEAKHLLEQARATTDPGAARPGTLPEPGPVHRPLAEALTLQDEAERALARLAVGYGAARSSLDSEVAAVCAAMGPRQALVEFFTWEPYGTTRSQHLGAVVLTRSGVQGWADLGRKSASDTQVARLHATLRMAGNAADDACRSLRECLVDPWRRLLPGEIDELVISPEGAACFTPFAALPDTDGRRLGECYAFALVISGRDLLAEERPRGTPAILALGDPDFGPIRAEADPTDDPREGYAGSMPLTSLPGARLELAGIADLARQAGWEARVMTGADAKEEVLDGPMPTVVHLSTHGLFLPRPAPGTGAVCRLLDSPMDRAAVALAGARASLAEWDRGAFTLGHDGVLTAREVSALDLAGTWLCVVSACEGGSGEAGRDGVLGLRRGLAHAGAAHIVTALWPVSDRDSAVFMQDFYRRLFAGNGPVQALCGVQREWFGRMDAIGERARALSVAGAWVVSLRGPWRDVTSETGGADSAR